MGIYAIRQDVTNAHCRASLGRLYVPMTNIRVWVMTYAYSDDNNEPQMGFLQDILAGELQPQETWSRGYSVGGQFRF